MCLCAKVQTLVDFNESTEEKLPLVTHINCVTFVRARSFCPPFSFWAAWTFYKLVYRSDWFLLLHSEAIVAKSCRSCRHITTTCHFRPPFFHLPDIWMFRLYISHDDASFIQSMLNCLSFFNFAIFISLSVSPPTTTLVMSYMYQATFPCRRISHVSLTHLPFRVFTAMLLAHAGRKCFNSIAVCALRFSR